MASTENVAGGEEVACVWAAAMPVAPYVVSFFCFFFPIREGVRLSPAMASIQMRGYVS